MRPGPACETPPARLRSLCREILQSGFVPADKIEVIPQTERTGPGVAPPEDSGSSWAGQMNALAGGIQEQLRQQVAEAHRQLEHYARELEEMAERERVRSAELESANRQLRAYSRDLAEAVERERLRSHEIEAAYLETVRRLTDASIFKDRETGAHIQRISHYSKELALAAGWDFEQAEAIYSAAPMHDLGKIGIPDRILHKPGPLDADEWILMKQHPEIGARLLEGSTSRLLDLGRAIALAHHERWDGSGYPYALSGEAIPFAARIVAIADNYDALRSARPYKDAFSHRRALAIILQGDGRTRPEHFDPHLLAVFAKIEPVFERIFDTFQDA